MCVYIYSEYTLKYYINIYAICNNMDRSREYHTKVQRKIKYWNINLYAESKKLYKINLFTKQTDSEKTNLRYQVGSGGIRIRSLGLRDTNYYIQNI